ncbi:MAG: c-type cytochrome biogenesis protein CcmI [Acetobacteraceae bacterium]|nr:c-type cytochrome biogenesis protein CcmI [Acetobacteraceae bacterium]
MIFVLIALLALAVLAPVLLRLRGPVESRGARDLAVDLHRTQLRELDRDFAEGRILSAEHATAKLEVQRRLLAAAAAEETAPRTGARWPVIATIVVVPLAAAGLYAVSGSKPSMPSSSGGGEQAREAETATLVEGLRDQLATMDPNTDKARQGYALLGTVEEQRGNDAAAAAAFRMALHGKFDPTIAARAAEAAVRAEGGVSESSAALFRRALAAAPADAPWRNYVEQRLQQPRLASRP